MSIERTQRGLEVWHEDVVMELPYVADGGPLVCCLRVGDWCVPQEIVGVRFCKVHPPGSSVAGRRVWQIPKHCWEKALLSASKVTP